MNNTNEKARYSTIESKSQLTKINGGAIPIIVFIKLYEFSEWLDEKVADWYESLTESY